ncbi:hypothetical protein R6Q59_006534 [Mikania micrantha]
MWGNGGKVRKSDVGKSEKKWDDTMQNGEKWGKVEKVDVATGKSGERMSQNHIRVSRNFANEQNGKLIHGLSSDNITCDHFYTCVSGVDYSLGALLARKLQRRLCIQDTREIQDFQLASASHDPWIHYFLWGRKLCNMFNIVFYVLVLLASRSLTD